MLGSGLWPDAATTHAVMGARTATSHRLLCGAPCAMLLKEALVTSFFLVLVLLTFAVDGQIKCVFLHILVWRLLLTYGFCELYSTLLIHATVLLRLDGMLFSSLLAFAALAMLCDQLKNKK